MELCSLISYWQRSSKKSAHFGIFSETRDSLKKLTIATLDILAASCGHRYSTSEIFKKVTFTKTDITPHNIGVMACNPLNLENIPQPFYNAHPLLIIYVSK